MSEKKTLSKRASSSFPIDGKSCTASAHPVGAWLFVFWEGGTAEPNFLQVFQNELFDYRTSTNAPFTHTWGHRSQWLPDSDEWAKVWPLFCLAAGREDEDCAPALLLSDEEYKALMEVGDG